MVAQQQLTPKAREWFPSLRMPHRNCLTAISLLALRPSPVLRSGVKCLAKHDFTGRVKERRPRKLELKEAILSLKMLDHSPRYVRRNATSARLCALGIRSYLQPQHADKIHLHKITTSILIILLQHRQLGGRPSSPAARHRLRRRPSALAVLLPPVAAVAVVAVARLSRSPTSVTTGCRAR